MFYEEPSRIREADVSWTLVPD